MKKTTEAYEKGWDVGYEISDEDISVILSEQNGNT